MEARSLEPKGILFLFLHLLHCPTSWYVYSTSSVSVHTVLKGLNAEISWLHIVFAYEDHNGREMIVLSLHPVYTLTSWTVIYQFSYQLQKLDRGGTTFTVSMYIQIVITNQTQITRKGIVKNSSFPVWKPAAARIDVDVSFVNGALETVQETATAKTPSESEVYRCSKREHEQKSVGRQHNWVRPCRSKPESQCCQPVPRHFRTRRHLHRYQGWIVRRVC